MLVLDSALPGIVVHARPSEHYHGRETTELTQGSIGRFAAVAGHVLTALVGAGGDVRSAVVGVRPRGVAGTPSGDGHRARPRTMVSQKS